MQSRLLPRIFRIVWRATSHKLTLWFGLSLVQGLIPAAIVYLSKLLIDGLTASLAARTNPREMTTVAGFAVAIAVLLLLAEVLRVSIDWLRTAQSRLIEEAINDKVLEKSARVDMAFYESSEGYDRLHRARDEANHRPAALVENVGALASGAVTLVSLVALILPFGWFVAIALVLATLPALLLVVAFAVKQHAWRVTTTQDRRRSLYYDWLLTFGANAAEVRMYRTGESFRTRARELRQKLRESELALLAKQYRAELLAACFALAIGALCTGWMLWRVAQGSVSLGDLVLFYGAFSQGQRTFKSLFAAAGQVYYNVLFLGDLFAFLDLPGTVVSLATKDESAKKSWALKAFSVDFENVSFRYPSARKMGIDDLSFSVRAGETVAIVGANGAGKSTVSKLLCRFYDPERGVVRVNGVDLRELDIDTLRSRIAVLFQEPVHYSANVRENIALAQTANEVTEEEIRRAIAAAGAAEFVDQLPATLDTPLGKWFSGGTELSVGQWQRIALARAYVRDAALVILDEPTSALDSWTEIDWMQRFRSITNGKTALIITHRFTTAMQADRILVMDAGRIVESGTHRELLALGGRYAMSWNAQMKGHVAPERATARAAGAEP
jgi:ATP-binding cassette, subfamily B, bacterial